MVAAAGLFAQTQARKFGLAQVYIQRYWEIDDRFIEEGCPSPGSANARRYLRLCEDEFEVARQGWIDLGVWRTWHSGIRLQVAELELDVSKYELLSQCVHTPEHQPSRCPSIRTAGMRRRFRWWFESALSG